MVRRQSLCRPLCLAQGGKGTTQADAVSQQVAQSVENKTRGGTRDAALRRDCVTRSVCGKGSHRSSQRLPVDLLKGRSNALVSAAGVHADPSVIRTLAGAQANFVFDARRCSHRRGSTGIPMPLPGTAKACSHQHCDGHELQSLWHTIVRPFLRS